MAIAARSLTYNALLSTTLDKWRKKLSDNLFTNTLTFELLKEAGNIEIVDGGYNIAEPLMYGNNSTVGSYSRYEVLDVAPQDGMTTAFYPWAQYAGSVSIDGLSEAQNRGPAQVISLLKSKVKQTMLTFSETMNEHLWDVADITEAGALTANGNKNIISIPMFVQKDPTAPSNPGTIEQSTEAWWRNQILDGETGTKTQFFADMLTLHGLCSKSTGGPPSVAISDMYAWNNMNAYLHATNRRYVNVKTASGGFTGIEWLGYRYFWDHMVPDMESSYNYDASWAESSVFMLNPKFLKLCVMRGKNFKSTKFQRPEDQDARVANFLWYGQLVCNNRRKQGVLFDLATTLTA